MKGKNSSYFIVLVLIVYLISCQSRVDIKKVLDVEDIDSIAIFSDTNSAKTVIKDKEEIDKIFNNYFAHSSTYYGKIPIYYSMILFKNNANMDSIYLDGICFKSSKTGSMCLKKDIRPFLDSCLYR